MKKFLSTLLAVVMMLSMFAPAMAEETGLPEMNTTDPITLSLLLWDDYELVRALADKFTEKYPNITVELLYTTTDTVNADLTNMAASGDLPDIYFWLDLDPLLANPWMADITARTRRAVKGRVDVMLPSLSSLKSAILRELRTFAGRSSSDLTPNAPVSAAAKFLRTALLAAWSYLFEGICLMSYVPPSLNVPFWRRVLSFNAALPLTALLKF